MFYSFNESNEMLVFFFPMSECNEISNKPPKHFTELNRMRSYLQVCRVTVTFLEIFYWFFYRTFCLARAYIL